MTDTNEQSKARNPGAEYRLGSGFEALIEAYEKASPEERMRLNKKLERVKYPILGYVYGGLTGIGTCIASAAYGLFPEKEPDAVELLVIKPFPRVVKPLASQLKV